MGLVENVYFIMLKVFIQKLTNSKTGTKFKFLVILFLHFVNFVRLLQLVNVTSYQSDCLFEFHHVNNSTGLLLTDRDILQCSLYQYRSALLCSVA